MDGDLRFCQVPDGRRIAYLVAGSGPFVIMPPGWFTSFSEFPSDALARFTQNHTIVMYDKLGTGLSDRDPPEFTLDSLVLELETVADAVQAKRFALLGMSHGGPTSMAYVARHPERVTRLVFYGTWARGGGWENRETLDALVGLVRANWPLAVKAIAEVFSPGVEVSAEELRARAASAERRTTPAIAAGLMEMFREIDVRDLLPSIQTPAMVLHRRDEQVALFDAGREIAMLLPNARFVPLEGAIHMPLADEGTEAFFEPLLRFLDEDLVETSTTQDSTAFRAILFSDVVASTPLLAQLKDEKMRAVMRDHDEVLAGAVGEHGGRVVKTIGDAFMAEFAVPSRAVDAAIAAQRGIRDKFADSDVPIRLRIGINAGEPIAEDGDLHGASVVIAKRLESEADHGGILVSEVVRQAVAGKEFEFVDRGEVALKGFDEPVRAWSVGWE